MEYVDDEWRRPRFLFHARAAGASASVPKPVRRLPSALHVAACLSASALLLFSSFTLVDSQTLSFLLVWAALSLFLGPFAPPSLTGGDPRVGRGAPLPPPPSPNPPPQPDTDLKKRPRGRQAPPPPLDPIPTVRSVEKPRDPIPDGIGSVREPIETEEMEWAEEDFEILKKQISRHPAGEPGRWDLIAEAFNGRHSPASVIKMSKTLSERKPGAGDSYSQFLKQRKPLDRRVDAANEELANGHGAVVNGADANRESWSSGDDLALLNALKAFPKEAAMRWEKIAMAVPGKSKAACMKRVAELKRDFRSSRASET